MKTTKIFVLLCIIAILGHSCRNDSDDFTVTPPVIEPAVIVTSSVLGTVIDNNGISVKGAMVTFEDQVTFTDDNGVFQFNDEQLYSSGTYIKVSKDGFFDGSRRFYASEGNTSIIAIELIPTEEVAEFSSLDGSIISFENVELNFKANSIMKEDGAVYSGNVNVVAKYLDPTLLNTLNQMPGDLTGTASDQNRVVLTSFAMIAVELLDDNGNKLQIQQGKTVDAKIPIPETLLDNAPATIPMWHFDEELGRWIEEGAATLVNGMYETSLAHFSFWNCDVSSNAIFLKGSITNRTFPIQGVNVVITVAGGGASASTITDVNGFFCGFVPNGVDLVLEISDHCGNLIYSTTITASEVDILLNPINLNIEINVALISGSVALCDGTPSSYTYVSTNQGILNNIIPVKDDLTFSGSIVYCDEESELSIRAIDPLNALASAVSTYSIDGIIETGVIELCEEQISPIFILKYGAVTDNWILHNKNNSDPADVNVNHFVEHIENGMQNGEILYKESYTIVTLDTDAGLLNDVYITFVEGQPLQDAEILVGLSGFKASGISSTQKVTQGEKNYLISTGTLSDIEITTPAWYDPSYVELFYYLAIELD